jgi:8-oxo-dGTP diphosphatase
MKFDYAIVDCLVEQDGKFLIVQEGKPGRRSRYNLPGGHVDDFETLAETAIREVKEETGYDVALTGFLGIYQSVFSDKSLNVAGPVFLGKVIGGELQVSLEHPEVKWVTANELIAMAERGKFWTKYPPLLVKDYQRRGVYPLELISSNKY